MKKILTSLLLITSVLTVDFAFAEGISFSVSSGVKVQPQQNIERILYGVKISPYVKKVLVTLDEKNISYELREILPTKLLLATKQPVPENFAKISPLGKIPAYQEKEVSQTGQTEAFDISDSAVIMEYLESTVKDHPLRPVSPKDNARVSFFIKYADDVLAPLTHKVLFEKIIKPGLLKEKTDESLVKNILNHQLIEVLDFLEKTLAADKRAWVANTTDFSLADIAVVTHLSTLMDAKMDITKVIGMHRPYLLEYVKKVLSRPSFKKISA